LKIRPFHDAKKEWRDEVMNDLWAIGVENWYVYGVSELREVVKCVCAVDVDEVAQCR